MKKTFKSFKEFLNRFFPKVNYDNKKYNLNKYQIYPEGRFLIESLNFFSQNLFHEINFNINHATCLGTCFAERLAEYLNKYSKSYQIKEANNFQFEANWGRVYTPKNLLQLIQYSTIDNYPKYIRETKNGFIDPIRDYACGTFNSKEELAKDTDKHRKISKEILSNKKFIFITLGQTEVWQDTSENFFWGNTPAKMNNFPDSGEYMLKNFNYTDTKKDLFSSIDLLKDLNKNIKIIFTLSPVPTYATFKKNNNVIISSSASKALLRTCINEILDEVSGCYYFPSYEYVVADNRNFIVDNRHVKNSKVDQIFKIFRSIQ